VAATTPRWRRILLKVSGEALAGPSGRPIDAEGLGPVVDAIAAAAREEVEVAVVGGGGNILRGAQTRMPGLGRTAADTMGMLATVINAIAMQEVLESRGVPTRVMTAIEMKAVAEPYIRRRAMRHLEKRRVVILAGGTGHPYFSTDTAAALRGVELGADVLLKGTQVDGVYDKDPKKHADARRFAQLSYEDVLSRRLEVMDRTAFTLCEEQRLPIVVFEMGVDGNLLRVIRGENVGTLISHAPPGGVVLGGPTS
jgi:uridylate kinase